MDDQHGQQHFGGNSNADNWTSWSQEQKEGWASEHSGSWSSWTQEQKAWWAEWHKDNQDNWSQEQKEWWNKWHADNWTSWSQEQKEGWASEHSGSWSSWTQEQKAWWAEWHKDNQDNWSQEQKEWWNKWHKKDVGSWQWHDWQRQHLQALELQIKAALALANDQLHRRQSAAVWDTEHDLDEHHHKLVNVLQAVHTHLHEAHHLLRQEVEEDFQE